MSLNRVVIVVMLLTAASTSLACMWDEDTLKDERRGMPGIAEVLAGQWEKHSEFFYRNRVQKMTAKLAADPHDLDAYDNLAVAYEKLGDHDSAIATMLQKEKLAPGQYTTYANLGTFYLHKGDFDPGIANIEKALAVNPDAHFGREEYQLKLARFMRTPATQSVPSTQPEYYEPSFPNFLRVDFNRKLTSEWRRRNRYYLDSLELKPNVFDGIVGLLRFGTGQSAELYYVLGELLAAKGERMLAYRAYLRAIELHHPHADEIRGYMSEVREPVKHQRALADDVIANERAAAAKWVAEYQAFEDGLIRAGKDTDDEANYAEFYKKHDRNLPNVFLAQDFSPSENPSTLFVIVLAVFVSVAIGLWYFVRPLGRSSSKAA
jgi:tetratricopeptide (TPR) repeat protein